MRNCPRLIAALVSALVAAVGVPGSSSAQSATTSAVTGQVTSVEGQPLSGVQIIVTNTQTGATQGVLTRSDGRYLLPGLPPGGGYTVQARAIGYATQSYTDVSLAISQTQRFDFQLAAEAVALEGISVTAERGAVISKDRMGTSTVVSDSAISRLPTITRDFTDFARLTPQISTGGAGTQAGGRNNRYNSIQIDGAVNNDLFGLAASGTPGGQAGAKPISLEAIQEFQVVLSPTDVRQGGFTGAGINAITKSGTNDFHGSLFYFNKNETLVGNYTTLAGDEARDFPDFSQNEGGFSLGGPVVKDKLHFFVNGELTRRSAPIGFVAGESGIPFTTAEVQQVADILRNQYGYDPGELGNVSLARESNLAFGRLDWQVNSNHRVTLRHNYVDAFDDNLTRSQQEYRLGGFLYGFNSTTNSTIAQLNSNVGDRFFNELRVGYTTVRDKRDVFDDRPSVRVNLPGSGARRILAGSEQFSGANSLDQNAFQISDDLTFPIGIHNLTLGTSNEFFSFANLFVRNAFGYYEFANPDSLAAGRPSRYEYSYLLPGGAPVAEFGVQQLAVYAQDQLNLSDNLTFTAGLRLDYLNLPDSPTYNPAVEQFFGRNTSEVPTNLLFNPRVGFNWDVRGDRTAQLRGGIGLFSGRTPGVWVSNAYGNTGVDYVRFTCSATGTVPAFNPDRTQQPSSCLGSTSLIPNEVNTIDPDFQVPQVWRANAAVDHRLPLDFTGTLEFLYTGTVQDIRYSDLSIAPVAGQTVEGGRPRYARRFSSSQLPTIGNVYELSNTDEGYSYSITGGLQRRFFKNFSLDAFYTYSRAEDVAYSGSSQASSNFRFRPAIDPNDPTLSTSDFEVPHRFVVNGSYQAEWFPRLATNFSFIYVGESGRPFSFLYDGDVNGDGQRSNDLLYVPAGASDIRFEPFRAPGTSGPNDQGQPITPEQSLANLEQFIDRFDCLQDARGEILERNACREPWQNKLDFRVSQVLPALSGQSLQLTLDVLNLLNLLNSDWGRNQFVNFGTYSLLSTASAPDAQGRATMRAFGNPDAQVYQLGDLSSRYQIQLGVRYAF